MILKTQMQTMGQDSNS